MDFSACCLKLENWKVTEFYFQSLEFQKETNTWVFSLLCLILRHQSAHPHTVDNWYKIRSKTPGPNSRSHFICQIKGEKPPKQIKDSQTKTIHWSCYYIFSLKIRARYQMTYWTFGIISETYQHGVLLQKSPSCSWNLLRNK